MGADLFIFKDKKEIAYFRDSYNRWNVLWQMHGSYSELMKCKTDIKKIEYLKGRLIYLNSYFEDWKEIMKKKHFEYFKEQALELQKWTEKAYEVVGKKGYSFIWSC